MRHILLVVRRIQLHLDEELDEVLARRAVEEGLSKAALIRNLLKAAVPVGMSDDPSGRLIASYEGDEDESTRIDEVVHGG